LRTEAKIAIQEAIHRKFLIGPDKECQYYPCHYEGQDCTWCYCPFYPCGNNRTGGGILDKRGKEVWDCKRCEIIHKRSTAKKILNALIKRRNIQHISKKELYELFKDIVVPEC
jgi:Zn-finger protein